MNRAGNSPQSCRRGRVLVMIGLVASLSLLGCRGNAPRSFRARAERTMSGGDASGRLTEGMKLLIESIQNPTRSFHFSYKALANLAESANAKPEIGPVEIEADVTPAEMSVNWTRGAKRIETKANKADSINWPMAQLELTEALFGSAVALAYGDSAARPAGSENVGDVMADKYRFDTSTLPAGARVAGTVMAFKAVRGTVWVEKATGRIVKFSIDAELTDQAGDSWKEHHELGITPQ